MPRPRSGSHIFQRGETWYYRRMVPGEYRAACGQVVVAKSLNTTSETEAERLEKEHDVEFERRLRRARDAANPQAVGTEIADRVRLETNSPNPFRHASAELAENTALTDEQREAAEAIIWERLEQRLTGESQINILLSDVRKLLPSTPLDPATWTRCRAGIVAVVGQHVATLIRAPSLPVTDGLHTLEWAFDRWLRAGGDARGEDVIATTRRHWDTFFADCKLVMLAEIRRSHLLAWRDRLIDAGKHKPKSINQRIQLVTAVLRQGWRDAEMAQPDLKALTVPEPDDSGRGAWSRGDILRALNALEPQSWQAWVYLLGLTTAARLGEPVARTGHGGMRKPDS